MSGGHGHGGGDGPGGGHGSGHDHGHEREHGQGHGPRDAHGNPPDLDAYLARLEAPDRVDWQRPDDVVRALRLRPGDVVGEVGAGPGYFTLRLAHAVGPEGRVHAVEVVPEILSTLRQRLQAAGVGNVLPSLGRRDDPGLPPGGCDLVLVVNTFHHFPDGVAFLQKLAAALRPGGRFANIDFHKRELPVGPPLEHKVSREDFLATAAAAGLALAEEHDFLPHQYFLVMKAK